MSLPAAGFHSHVRSRLVIYPEYPPNNPCRQVIFALQRGRTEDASRNLRKAPGATELEQTWRAFLGSRIRWEEGDYVHAQQLARLAGAKALCLQAAHSDGTLMLWSLASAAIETEAHALRRQDRFDAAQRTHMLAWELRSQHGSSQEQVETALSLAACADWKGDANRAEKWFQVCTRLEAGDETMALHKAAALSRYSTWLTRACRHEEAIGTACAAHKLMHQFMPGELSTIAAGVCVLQAQIAQAESLHHDQTDHARTLLKEAALKLRQMVEALRGFGSHGASELSWCELQLDYVDRLQRSLD